MNIEKIFTLSDVKLKKALRNEMVKLGYSEGTLHNKKDFLYAEGNAPYMLVAHLDTVHKTLPSIICYSKNGDYMMSPQGIGGDDRCGVYIILTLLAKLPFKPYVLFTMDEEIGGKGASAFVDYMMSHDIPDLKYIVEYDRKDNDDCVFYGCGNQDFIDFVESFDFKEAYGTFSDISIIAPEFSVAAVNLSSGYYNPHTEHEYVSFSDMHRVIERSVKMLCADCEPFVYITKSVTYYNHQTYGCWGEYDVSATFVPEATVWIRDSVTCDWRANKFKEIAVDAHGNFYKYSSYFGDYIHFTEVSPIEPGFEPEYDANNAYLIEVFDYNYGY
jgi:hypothetical protein